MYNTCCSVYFFIVTTFTGIQISLQVVYTLSILCSPGVDYFVIDLNLIDPYIDCFIYVTY